MPRFISLMGLAFIFIIALHCKTEGVEGTDFIPPTITIDFPANGAVFNGSLLTVQGIASDNWVVAKVEVKVDGGDFYLANGTVSWSYDLDLSVFEDGEHTIAAKATNLDNKTSTTTVTISVDKTAE